VRETQAYAANTYCAPIHLQWQGHCVTIVGVANALNHHNGAIERHIIVMDTMNMRDVLWSVNRLNMNEYQLVIIRGVQAYDDRVYEATRARGFNMHVLLS
jgi:hypothetical protein